MASRFSYAGFALFLILGIFIGISKPFLPRLDNRGHIILMLLLVTIGLWIFKPGELPFSVSGAFFMASMLWIGLPAATVFSGFTGNAIWALIPALFFGFALAKTGLGKRIAYLGMKNTRLSYGGIIFMWAVIGIVLSLLTPSIVVRVVIVMPIALNSVNICRLKEGTRERSLILLTAWAMAVIPGAGWLSGSLTGPVLNGFFAGNPALGPISFGDWMKVSLLPIMLVTILTLLIGYFVLKPSGPLNLSREAFVEEYKKLGSISAHEKICGLILVLSFLMFATNSIHHIPDAAICLIAWVLLTVFGIIKSNEISTGISWDLVIFSGAALGLGGIFSVSGLSGWLSGIIVDALAPISGHPWLLIYVLLISMFIWRFVDIAVFIPTMAIITAVLPQVAEAYGINPLLWIPLIAIALNAFFLSYQNIFVLVAQANLGGQGWKQEHLMRYGIAYFAACMLAMTVAIPYWISIGMFG